MRLIVNWILDRLLKMAEFPLNRAVPWANSTSTRVYSHQQARSQPRVLECTILKQGQYFRCMSRAPLFWFRIRKWTQSFVFRLYTIVYVSFRLCISYFSSSAGGAGEMLSPLFWFQVFSKIPYNTKTQFQIFSK